MKKRVAKKLVKVNLLKATTQKRELVKRANIRNKHVPVKTLTDKQNEEYEKFIGLFR